MNPLISVSTPAMAQYRPSASTMASAHADDSRLFYELALAPVQMGRGDEPRATVPKIQQL